MENCSKSTVQVNTLFLLLEKTSIEANPLCLKKIHFECDLIQNVVILFAKKTVLLLSLK